MKDPAVLFYFNDWQGGTVTFSRFLKGCYMDLLHAQFNSGGLSLDEIKTVLGSDFGQSWPTLQKKFQIGEDNLYYNKRLLFEKTRRKEFSLKQKERVNNRYKKTNSLGTTNNESKNINEIEIDSEIKKVWEIWIENKPKKFKNDYAEQIGLLKFLKLCNGDSKLAIEIVEQSLANSWSGLFPLRKESNNSQVEIIKNKQKIERFGSVADSNTEIAQRLRDEKILAAQTTAQ